MSYISNEKGISNLLNTAILAKKIGAETGNNQYINLDEKYNSTHILKMARNLSLPEISLLLNLSKLREKSLSLLRENNIKEGSALLFKAKEIDSQVELSSESILVLDTFQTAAEAFLFYKLKEFDKAIELLYQSIESLRTLHNNYGYECEIRRIHLTKNIIRSLSSDNKTKEAMGIASNLLRYLSGDSASWPIYISDWQTVEDISKEEKWILADQILNEISILLSMQSNNNDEILEYLNDLKFSLKKNSDMQKIYFWIEANYSISKKNKEDFLLNTIKFFKGGRCYLHSAWKQIDLKLQEI